MKYRSRAGICLIVCFFLGWMVTLPVFSSSPLVKKIGLEHGLSDNNVLSITQDRQGFLWFATDWGLNRFDGNGFKVYKAHPTEKNTIRSNGLNRVLADPQRDLIWIASQNTGLSAFDCVTQTFIHYPVRGDEPNVIGANGVTDLCFADDGNLWMATYNNGLKKLNVRANKVTHYTPAELPELKSHNLWSVADDGNGHLYLGHVNEGMSMISLKDWKVKNYQHNPDDPNSLPHNTVSQVYIDSRKNVWVATVNGLALFHPEKGEFTVFRHEPDNPYSLLYNDVHCIREIGQNSLWVGSMRGGISILDIPQHLFSTPEEVRFRHIRENDLPTGLSSQSVASLFQDSFGNVWIGTLGGGINFISHQTPFFNTLTYSPFKGDQNGLSSKAARAICVDKQGQLWIGTDAGVDVYKDGKKVKTFNEKNKNLPDNRILSALCDSQGDIWLGLSQGVLRYNKQKDAFEQVKLASNHLLEYYVSCMYEDRDKNLWVGSNSGILRYNLLTKEVKESNATRMGGWNYLVRSISQDHNGNIWVGTLINAITLITPELKVIRTLDVANGVMMLLRDSKNRMWIGTRNGIVVVDPDDTQYTHTKYMDKENGLADNFIMGIAEGGPNEMWFATNSGLSRYTISTGKFNNYTYSDNIPLGSFRPLSVAKAADGTIYFGSQAGVCYFNPTDPRRQDPVPATHITGFTIYDTGNQQDGNSIDIPVLPDMKLNYDQNTFTLDFNVMDYGLNDKVEYSYQLKGMDDLWHSTNGQNEVTFRNIPPGSYIFTVTARIRNQEWSEKTASVKIEIAPPFWLSWWAKTIYVIVILWIILSLARFYKRKLNLEGQLYLEQENHKKEQELNDEKLRFYTNIAHELRTPLTLIIGPLGDLLVDDTIQPEQNKKISLIHRSAARLMTLINQILEFRKSETSNRALCVKYGDLSGLVREIGLKYKELNQNQELAVDIRIEAEQVKLYYDPEVLTIILDNLISNALKCTQRGQVSIRMRNTVVEDQLHTEIEVSDTGRGIPENELARIFDRYYQVKGDQQSTGSGIGLALVKNMVQLHKGTICVDSKVNHGTSFYFSLSNEYTYPDAAHQEEAKSFAREKQQADPVLLVVEDNKDIREYIASTLQDQFEVLTAENGQVGTEIALEKMPDLIISDIMMPIMDGISLCKIVKEDIRTCHIPVILLTAKDSLQDKAEGYSIGADSYLTKPFTAQLLQNRVHNLLESRKKLVAAFSTGMKSEAQENAFSRQDNEFIEKTVAFIKEHLESEQLNIGFLADHLCMSHSTFYRKIKALTGMTGNELVRKIKMQAAEQMMHSPEMTISEIALRVGFSSMTHFRHSFKTEYGVLPSDYIKKLKSQ